MAALEALQEAHGGCEAARLQAAAAAEELQAALQLSQKQFQEASADRELFLRRLQQFEGLEAQEGGSQSQAPALQQQQQQQRAHATQVTAQS